jgi:hypothetical protein
MVFASGDNYYIPLAKVQGFRFYGVIDIAVHEV